MITTEHKKYLYSQEIEALKEEFEFVRACRIARIATLDFKHVTIGHIRKEWNSLVEWRDEEIEKIRAKYYEATND